MKKHRVGSKKALQLLVRQRELKAIYDLFSQVNQFNEAKKRKWIKENSEIVTDAFLSFLEANKFEIDGAALSGDSQKIALEILDLLDQTTEVMQDAFDPKERLEA